MQFKKILAALAMVTLLLVGGCVTAKPDGKAKVESKAKTWIDLEDISDHIVKAKEQGKTLEPTVAADEASKKEPPPKVKDLTDTQGSSENPYLKKIVQPGTGKAAAGDGEGVTLNFDNADIYEVIQVIAETLSLNYIVDPQVKGVVNIRSGQKIPKDQLFVVFKKLLNINGLDIRSEGSHDYIYVAKKPSSQAVYGREDIGKLTDSSKLVTQVVPVVNISSTEALKLVEPYLSAQGTAFNLAEQNVLILSDFESKIVDVLVILSHLDVSAVANLKVRLFRVQNAPLFDLRDELVEILKALRVNKNDYEGVQVLALERVNSLLLVGNNDGLMKTAEKWIEQLDDTPTGSRDNIFVYNVRNSVASELSDLVNNLIGEATTVEPKVKTPTKMGTTPTSAANKGGLNAPKALPGTPNPAAGIPQPGQPAPGAKPAGVKGAKGAGGSSTMQFAGQPLLFADDSRNIILIRALNVDYQRLMKVMERLDNLPRQVLIEVLVAEVSLSDGWEYGVEWALKKNKTDVNDWEFGKKSSDKLAGLNLTFQNQGDIFKLLEALATKNNFSILSSPQVLVLNNETATVNVGEQVPIVTSIIGDSTTATTNPSNRTVQYKDTGVILAVTPRINYDGIILVDIDQQVSSVKEGSTGVENSPTISTKQVKTKLAIKDGQSILMGGLISKNTAQNDTGVPFLKDIPVLGWAFKNQNQKTTKTELLIMITPYVIESENVLDQYVKNFKEKITGLRKEISH